MCKESALSKHKSQAFSRIPLSYCEAKKSTELDPKKICLHSVSRESNSLTSLDKKQKQDYFVLHSIEQIIESSY